MKGPETLIKTVWRGTQNEAVYVLRLKSTGHLIDRSLPVIPHVSKEGLNPFDSPKHTPEGTEARDCLTQEKPKRD